MCIGYEFSTQVETKWFGLIFDSHQIRTHDQSQSSKYIEYGVLVLRSPHQGHGISASIKGVLQLTSIFNT